VSGWSRRPPSTPTPDPPRSRCRIWGDPEFPCLHPGAEPLEFSTEPATVSDAAASDAGDEYNGTRALEVDRTLNPIGSYSNARLVELIQRQYSGLGNVEQ
jgi:hypothetical protein